LRKLSSSTGIEAFAWSNRIALMTRGLSELVG